VNTFLKHSVVKRQTN